MNRFQPLLRASAQATSSRVTLDAIASTRAASARAFSTTSSLLAREKRDPNAPLRWAPESPEPFRNSNGLADRAPTHTLTVEATRNNVILTFTDKIGPLVGNVTAGQGGKFKGAARSSYEAAYQAATKMIGQIMTVSREFRERQEGSSSGDVERMYVRVAFKGLMGQGRDAVSSAIAGPEGAEIRNIITRVEDRTPIKIGGTRARKPRRL